MAAVLYSTKERCYLLSYAKYLDFCDEQQNLNSKCYYKMLAPVIKKALHPDETVKRI